MDGEWNAQLNAAEKAYPLRAVPSGRNTANIVRLDYAEAGLSLAIASSHADPFGSSFNAHLVKRDYNKALSKLQDALNSCALAGVPSS